MASFPSPLTNSKYRADTYSIARSGLITGRTSRPPVDFISCTRLHEDWLDGGQAGDPARLSLDRPSLDAGVPQAGDLLSPYCSHRGACDPVQLRDLADQVEVTPATFIREESAERNINFLQINLHKGKASTYELNRWEFDIALVQEPNITGKGKINLVQAPLQYYSKGVARAAVLVRDGIDYWPVEDLSTEDMAVVALALEHSESPLYVGSVYLDILKDPIIRELSKLVSHCDNQQIPLIMGIDSNAHSAFWNSDNPNARGIELEEWIVHKGLYVHNVGNSPTFTPITGVTHTIIDITLTNRWAMNWISDWRVEDTISLSDHRIITYNCEIATSSKKAINRSFRGTNWNRFQEKLAQVDTSWMTMDWNVNDISSNLTINIREILDIEAPNKERKIRTTNKWWTPALELLRAKVKAAYRMYNKQRCTKDRYLCMKRAYTKEIKEAKTRAWQRFITKAESAKEVSKIVRILEDPPIKKMNLLVDDRNITLTPQESLNRLLYTHFPDGEVQGQNKSGSDREQNLDFTGPCLFITPKKVKAAFNSFGDYKAVGPDEIPPIALKHIDEVHLEITCLLYKLSLATGIIPEGWKEMRVVFIPKSGKSDYSIAKAYRPITLSNFLLKGLERIIQWYILDHVIKEPFFNQHAYTKGRSCETALSTFVDDVEYAIYNKKQVLAVSLDCSGAFDCIKFESAENCMIQKNIPSNIIRWYMNLLRQRKITAQIQGQSAYVIPKRGSPQGGVLSPLIWNIIMDSLLSTFKNDSIKVLGYADDIVIYIIGTIPSVMQEIIQQGLNRVTEWGDTNGLTFNPQNPTKTTPIWEARKWRIASAGTQNLRYWGQIWRRRGGARLRRAAQGRRKAAQGRRKAAPGGARAAQGCAGRRKINVRADQRRQKIRKRKRK